MIGTRAERVAELNDLVPVWQPQTIWMRFESAAKAHPESEFIVLSDGRRLTYTQAFSDACQVADALVALGIGAGDCVAFKLTNCPELIALMLASAKIGAIKTGLNDGAGGFEAAYAVDSARAKVLFLDSVPRFPESWNPKTLSLAVTVGETRFDTKPVPSMSWHDMMEKAKAGSAVEATDSEAISDILFTSGSTGNPKGAMLGHDQLLRSAFSNCLNRGYERGRRILVLVPLHHCFGYVEGMLSAMFVGGAIVLPTKRFTPRELVGLAQRESVNDMLSVSYTMNRLVEYLEAQSPAIELPTLHALYCGGERGADTLWPRMRHVLGIEDIVNGYGMTEICGAAMQTVPLDSDEILMSKVGRILPAGCAGDARYNGNLIEYEVRDRTSGKHCQPNEFGELYCRGLTVMKGYCNVDVQPFDDEGWMATGDIGRFDDDGYLELLGRARDVYRINGENVSPAFVERIVSCCKPVKRAAIVGIPDAKLGAVGCLFVELAPDTPMAYAELERFCEDNLARYQVPRYCIPVEDSQWPLTSSGKVKREVLKKIAAERIAGKPEAYGFARFAQR